MRQVEHIVAKHIISIAMPHKSAIWHHKISMWKSLKPIILQLDFFGSQLIYTKPVFVFVFNQHEKFTYFTPQKVVLHNDLVKHADKVTGGGLHLIANNSDISAFGRVDHRSHHSLSVHNWDFLPLFTKIARCANEYTDSILIKRLRKTSSIDWPVLWMITRVCSVTFWW